MGAQANSSLFCRRRRKESLGRVFKIMARSFLEKVARAALRPWPSPSAASGDGIGRGPKVNATPQGARCAGKTGRRATGSTGQAGRTRTVVNKLLPDAAFVPDGTWEGGRAPTHDSSRGLFSQRQTVQGRSRRRKFPVPNCRAPAADAKVPEISAKVRWLAAGNLPASAGIAQAPPSHASRDK